MTTWHSIHCPHRKPGEGHSARRFPRHPQAWRDVGAGMPFRQGIVKELSLQLACSAQCMWFAWALLVTYACTAQLPLFLKCPLRKYGHIP